MADAGMIISMENITKVFFTDEVETHALSGIHMEIRKGEAQRLRNFQQTPNLNPAVRQRAEWAISKLQ